MTEVVNLDVMTIDINAFTPMMQQYINKKREYPDEILFFRLGDFYEMFFNDALTVSRELEIALTGRDAGYVQKVPMCGVPHHSSMAYIERLIAKGYKVAICEQVTEPQKGMIVERDVVKIYTAGNFNLTVDNTSSTVYTVSVMKANFKYYIAYCDVSVGNLYAVEIESRDEAVSFLQTLSFAELVCNEDLQIPFTYTKSHISPQVYTVYKDILTSDQQINDTVALLVSYFIQTNKQEMPHLRKTEIISFAKQLILDYHTIVQLELTSTQRTNTKKGSLFYEIDNTKTAMGSRLLKSHIEFPLQDLTEIQFRQNFAFELGSNYNALTLLRKHLNSVYDLERITSKISLQTVNPRDLVQLMTSLSVVPQIIEIGDQIPSLHDFFQQIVETNKLYTLLETAIIDEPPVSHRDGNVIRTGFDTKLDNYRFTKENATDLLLKYEAELRELTSIKTLKVSYNRNFGYYIEVTKSNVSQMDEFEQFERRQTLTNAQRYTTPRLKEFEADITRSNDQLLAHEISLFIELRVRLSEFVKDLQKLCDQIAFLDVMASNAMLLERGFIQPVQSENEFWARDLRHAVIENIVENKAFVPNDINMTDKDIYLITGPNMSGKSTYMRSVAHMIILNQIGSFIPCSSACLPIFDRIFTRIGSSDDLLLGQSTFMVEMMEVNNALQHATKKSLILLDEIGRGTATYDGLAIAQSVVEYIDAKIHAKTLFATHYHELVDLENKLSSLQNVHVSASEEKGGLKFLHKVMPGPVDKSYGIHVASLAKLPQGVIKRAQMLLETYENSHVNFEIDVPNANFDSIIDAQPDFSEIIEMIDSANIDSLTPMQALTMLYDIQNEINKKK